MFSRTLIMMLVAVAFVPFFDVRASESSFIYRSTEMGSGTRQTGQWEYEITNEKYDFSTSESVFALTRIFNITNVNTFQFKYEVRGESSRDILSPVYRPNGNWWAEIWYWDEFGTLPAGSYSLRTMISVDNGDFKYFDSKYFSVDGPSYHSNTYNYNDYSSGYCQYPEFDFEWAKTGKNIRNLDSYVKEISNQTRNFSTNENIYVLAKNSHIEGVDSFRIKFDVYLNGNRYYKTNEVPTLNPNCNTWAYNYSWANLGRLPKGNHEIRTFIKINNGGYRLLDTEKINVSSVKTTTNYNYHQPITSSNKSVIDYNYLSANEYNYAHAWTQTDSNVNFLGDYRYSVDGPKDIFSIQDEVRVLTRLSDIRNIRTFKIRHELHKNGRYERKIESAERTPHYRYWEYNYTQSNFGRLFSGNYEIKTYISVEGDAWRQLDSKKIVVSGNSYTSNDYNFDYTSINTDFDYSNYYY
jgi:hypothetical protein